MKVVSKYHVPVMLSECLEGLNINPAGIYVDVTFGGGGHSRAILAQLNEKGKLIAFDQDEDAKKNIPNDDRVLFIDQNFEFLKNHLAYQNIIPVDGILADIGVSSHQFDTGERGFSFRFDDAILDMRMNTSQGLTAAEILNTYSEEKLANVLYNYGELRSSRKLASEIAAFRNRAKIETVAHLKDAIKNSTPKFKDYQFLAPIFQALRIEVNQELEVLKNLLVQSAAVLKSKGRIVVMSYHSLEDRLVKNFFNSGNFEGEIKKDFYGKIERPLNPLNKKAIGPRENELLDNPRARSAKLRVAEKN